LNMYKGDNSYGPIQYTNPGSGPPDAHCHLSLFTAGRVARDIAVGFPSLSCFNP
jgi:hypothetical protein